MTRQTIEAVYAGGVLKPLRPLQGIAENGKVTVTVTAAETERAVVDCAGTLPDGDAREMRGIVEAEFERVDPDEWK
jgi:predicted DNA-binding antitoxin AbrB/MazE fold protein